MAIFKKYISTFKKSIPTYIEAKTKTNLGDRLDPRKNLFMTEIWTEIMFGRNLAASEICLCAVFAFGRNLPLDVICLWMEFVLGWNLPSDRSCLRIEFVLGWNLP